MALRWRIRHKLMLGLGLVVGIMALLLGGTLRSLWSYYLTTSGIRANVGELKEAEDLKEAIARLVAAENVAGLLKHPAWIVRDPARPHPSKVEGWKVTDIDEVKDKLKEYEDRLQESLAHNEDHPDDNDQQYRVNCLRAGLDSFREAIEAATRLPAVAVCGEGEPEGAEKESKKRIDREAERLSRNAHDLRSRIYEQLAWHLTGARRHYQIALWIVLPSSIVGLLLMAGLMRSFYAWVFNPVRDLEAGVKRVAQGDFEHRIELHSGDEMEDLAAAFNDMMGRLRDLYCDLARQVNERSRQLVRSERLASVGFLAAGVAHEINNPLASIAFCSEALEARLGDLLAAGPGRPGQGSGRTLGEAEVFSKYLKMIQEEAFRCKSITERLLAFSRTGERRREPTDLGQLVQSVLDITQHLQNSRGKQIAFEKQPERGQGRIVAPVNADEIKSVVLNLVVNALDSMEEGGRLTIQLLQKDGLAEMRFTDTGCGMTQEVLENIFEPFFTRSRTGKGTGLGLTISHQIISQHSGEIEATSPGLNQGSTFIVRLPLQFEDPLRSDPPAASPERRPLERPPKRSQAA